jgi:hypothetical protein
MPVVIFYNILDLLAIYQIKGKSGCSVFAQESWNCCKKPDYGGGSKTSGCAKNEHSTKVNTEE